MEAFDEGTRMREILEAVLQEHVTNETYEEWFREAADEVEDALGTEGETAIPPGRSESASGAACSYTSRRGPQERCRTRCGRSPGSVGREGTKDDEQPSWRPTALSVLRRRDW